MFHLFPFVLFPSDAQKVKFIVIAPGKWHVYYIRLRVAQFHPERGTVPESSFPVQFAST
jgi:hypothetical protein